MKGKCHQLDRPLHKLTCLLGFRRFAFRGQWLYESVQIVESISVSPPASMKISPVEGLESLRPVGFLVRLPVLELRAVDFAARKSYREKPRARRLTCLCPVCPFCFCFPNKLNG